MWDRSFGIEICGKLGIFEVLGELEFVVEGETGVGVLDVGLKTGSLWWCVWLWVSATMSLEYGWS